MIDPEKLPELLNTLRGPLTRYAKKLSPGNEEDLVQEVFEKRLRTDSIPEFPALGDLLAYLKRSVKNAAISHSRRKRSKTVHVTLNEQLIGEESDPQAAMIEREEAEIAQACLAKCMRELAAKHTEYAEAVTLFHLDGKSHKEIAEQAGISEGTSRTRVAKGMKKLKECARKCIQQREAPPSVEPPPD